MKTKSKALKKQRAELAIIISRRCFPKYNEFVKADEIVANVHDLLLNNKDKFLAAFTARVRAPLYKITDRQSSKRHCISFLRRLSSYYGNVLVSKRRSAIVNGRPVSVYEYALLRIN